MPSIAISYSEGDMRALIAKDLKERFGISLKNEKIQPDMHASEGSWTVEIDPKEAGQVEAALCPHSV